MSSIEVRIVGTITDTTQLDDLTNIAKIFVYEHRMKTIILQKTPPTIPATSPKKRIHTFYHHHRYTPHPTLHHIRGFA